jgi:ATP-dependent Clp protease adaptor protein ClpS
MPLKSCPQGRISDIDAIDFERCRVQKKPHLHHKTDPFAPGLQILGNFFPEGAPEEERESSVALEEELDHLWKVIVWNDPVNLMSYVVYVLQKIFGHSKETATRHMLEVHHDGKSIVCLTEQEKGERYVSQLHSFGLQATLEKDG